jgi:hypothetical protein
MLQPPPVAITKAALITSPVIAYFTRYNHLACSSFQLLLQLPHLLQF